MLPVVLFAAGVFLPLTKLITLVSALVLRLFGVDLADDDDNVTEEDIMSMVNEGHEQGVLEAGETEMITNIFQLGDKEAWDIMTHRTNMTALDGAMLLGDAVHFILNEGINTRYPVYREDIDDIVGILHMRDAMVYVEMEEYKDRPLLEVPDFSGKPTSYLKRGALTPCLRKCSPARSIWKSWWMNTDRPQDF